MRRLASWMAEVICCMLFATRVDSWAATVWVKESGMDGGCKALVGLCSERGCWCGCLVGGSLVGVSLESSEVWFKLDLPKALGWVLDLDSTCLRWEPP